MVGQALAGRVDVVHRVGDMAKIAATTVGLGAAVGGRNRCDSGGVDEVLLELRAHASRHLVARGEFGLVLLGDLRAIAESITSNLRDEYNVRPRAEDGTLQTGWLVIDFFDVIVHVMRKEVRERYDLESLWGDAPKVKPPAAKKKAASKKA